MRKIIGLALAVIFLFTWQWAISDARLLRFPNINGDLVAFVYAGDIWSVPAAGGDARRLTSHPGLELFPKISPDGQWIAFSAEYSGSRQVYVMPAAGGTPRQLTYYNDVGIMPPRGGYDYVVMDWTPDSRQVLVRCNRTPWGERMGKYFLGRPGRRPGDAVADPGRRRRHVFPGCRQDRLHPHREGVPHLEALQGRPGPGRLDLRPGQQHLAAPDRFSRHRPAPGLVRQTRFTSFPTAT